MRKIFKRLLASAAVQLPWGARTAVLDAMIDRYGSDPTWFIQQARKLNVAGVLVEGEWGIIQSSIEDRMILPIYARTGTWARRTADELREFFGNQSGTYIDIGANIGLTTIPVARLGVVQCIAFEPDRVNFLNLTDNVRRNVSMGNVQLHQIALYDADTTVHLGLSDTGNLGDHRVVSAAHEGDWVISVEAKRLDSLVLETSGPLAVKIDVQGAEPRVLAGGRRVISSAGLLIIEYSPYLINKAGSSCMELIDVLSSFADIAVNPGEDDRELDYRRAGTVCSELERFFNEAKDDEGMFLDVYARR